MWWTFPSESRPLRESAVRAGVARRRSLPRPSGIQGADDCAATQVHHGHAALQLRRAARRWARRPSPRWGGSSTGRQRHTAGECQAAGEAGELRDGFAGSPVARSTSTTPPVPDSSTQSWPSCQRGEWGIDRPRVTNSPDGTSMMQPPCGLSARQPSRMSVVPSADDESRLAAVHRQAVQMAAILGGQRRDERRPPARDEAVVGVERARHENRVLTIHSSSPAQAIS